MLLGTRLVVQQLRITTIMETVQEGSSVSVWGWRVFRIVATVILAWILLRAGRLLRIAYRYLNDAYVFWSIVTGSMGGSRTDDTQLRMHVYLCETKYLDEVAINELYNFIREFVDSDHGTVHDAHRVMLNYSHVMMCREKRDGTLRGMMLVGVDRKGEYTLIKIGLALYKNNYRGGPSVYLVPAYMMLRELILHPRTPVYSIGKAFSYKSYLTCSRFKEFYPRYDKETPEDIRKIVIEYGETTKAPNERFNPETFVIEREVSRVKDYVASLTERELQNPVIRFFNERNPGWKKGHCMIGICRVCWSDLFGIVLAGMKRSKRSKPGSKSAPANGVPAKGKPKGRKVPPPLYRRFTFQEPLANGYAVNAYEMDFGGAIAERQCNLYATRQLSMSDISSPMELDVKF